MFKKDGSEQARPQASRAAQGPAKAQQVPARHGSGQATIGPSIIVKGDISGDEDLVIQGRVEGSVTLDQHSITIGGNGRVKADVNGRMVVVEGEVTGDLRAQEQIILRQTAKVEGSIAAPRVALEDGAIFRGSIEMDSKGPAVGAAPAAAVTKDKPSSGVDAEKTTSSGKGPEPKAAT